MSTTRRFSTRDRSFCTIVPIELIITSLEFDHADIYADLAAIELQFRRLVNLIPRRGRIVCWGESPTVRGVVAKAFCKVETYGFGADNVWIAGDIEFSEGATHFRVARAGEERARIRLPMAGRHNVLNALAATAIADGRGIPREAIERAFAEFRGVARRMQVRGEAAGVTVVDDFAHHPTAIRATIEGARSRWPGHRLWVAFEPRSNTMRRRVFEEELSQALAGADGVVLGGVNRADQLTDAERLSPERVVARLRAAGRTAESFASADKIADYLGRGTARRGRDARALERQLRRAVRQIAGAPFSENCRAARGSVEWRRGGLRAGRLWQAVAFFCLALLAVATPARATIRYEISLARPAQHQFHVTMTIPDVRQSVTVQIPAWSTLYQIRDFGYHVLGLHASDAAGKPLRVTRSDKQTWTIQGQGEIRIEYADYWDEPGPFGTQLNREHAFLNLAMVLCYIPDRRAEESVVHFSDVPQAGAPR